jgi:hypothetical protein
VDVLLVRVPAEHELELGRGHELADDSDDVVADDPLGRGEVADAHAHDPAIDVAERALVAPSTPFLLARTLGDGPDGSGALDQHGARVEEVEALALHVVL